MRSFQNVVNIIFVIYDTGVGVSFCLYMVSAYHMDSEEYFVYISLT